MFTNASFQWQQGGVLLINAYHVLVYHSLSNSAQTASTRPALHVASYYPSQPTVYFLAQLLSVSKRKANEVNVILGQRCGDSVQYAGWNNSWVCLMAAEKLFQRHFGWRNNCFQSSTWRNCTLSTQKSSPPSKNLLPTNIYGVFSHEKLAKRFVFFFFLSWWERCGEPSAVGVGGLIASAECIFGFLQYILRAGWCRKCVHLRWARAAAILTIRIREGNHSGWL